MGRDAAKACENQCFRCRKEAAKYNDKLGSREGAAELLGISVSSLADYELGNTKVIPVDKVVLMADIYNAPELMAWYRAILSWVVDRVKEKKPGLLQQSMREAAPDEDNPFREWGEQSG